MKTRKLCLCALACFVLMCISVYGQSPDETSEPVINFGLAGVDQMYVRVIADTMAPDKLEDEISSRLSRNGFKIVPADVSKLDDEQMKKISGVFQWKDGETENTRKVYMSDVPELIVRISVLQGFESGPCVYHVQTSFAREVYLRGSRARMKAEVWRIDVPVNIAEPNECDSAVTTSALGQADAFIAEWKKVNTAKFTNYSGEPKDDAVTPATKEQDEQVRQRVGYEYLASKNSKVFHKKGCRAAARISSENLIGFSSRDEAIQSGRRPCKLCNP